MHCALQKTSLWDLKQCGKQRKTEKSEAYAYEWQIKILFQINAILKVISYYHKQLEQIPAHIIWEI